jgi:hypothetical protein
MLKPVFQFRWLHTAAISDSGLPVGVGMYEELLHNLYSSLTIIKFRRMRWAEHVARMGEDRKVYKILVGKP